MIPDRLSDQLRIVLYPDPVLRKKCAPVTDFDEKLARLAEIMIRLMHDARGVGLAAPQVGVPVRLFVCNDCNEEGMDSVWVNPVLSEFEGGNEAEEGCLSLPVVSVLRRRATRCRIDGYGLDGVAKSQEAGDLLARIWQHETDHLDGRLIIDAMAPACELANRRIIKQLEADFSSAKR